MSLIDHETDDTVFVSEIDLYTVNSQSVDNDIEHIRNIVATMIKNGQYQLFNPSVKSK